jgi:hypothetical protein
MKTPEFYGAIAGNEAKGLVYANIPPDILQSRGMVNDGIIGLQSGITGYDPDVRTYFKYTSGYVQAGLGSVASTGKIRHGFVSNGHEGARALAGDLCAFSHERPWLALSDFVERNGGNHPRIQAIEALLTHQDGLSVADLNDLVYGEGHRRATGPLVYYRQLKNHGIVEIHELPGAGNDRDAKTNVVLQDDAIDDCMQFIDIVRAHGADDQVALGRGLAHMTLILENPDVVRELVRKSFATSPWAQGAEK